VTIHIIEDDPGVADALALLLAQLGHQTVVHCDAESFFENPPPAAHDTVIVDLGLPGLTGIQVIRWIDQLQVRPKVIAITGQPKRVIMEMVADYTPAILLRKPLTEEALVEHL